VSLVQALKGSTAALRRFKAGSSQAEASVSKLGRTATTTGAAVDRFKASAGNASGAVRDIGKAADAAERDIGRTGKAMGAAGKAASAGGGLMGRMRTGLGGVTGAVKGLNTAMKANIFGLIMALLLPLVMKLVDMAMQSKTVQRIVQVAFRIIGQVMGATMRVAKVVVEATWNAIKKAFDVALKLIVAWVRFYFNLYKAIISGVIAAVMFVVRPMIDFFRTKIPVAFAVVKDALHRAWGGLAGFVKGVFNSVLGAVRDPINGVISLVNSAIRALNRVKVSVPSWIPDIGGQTFGINIPVIPTLAGGGIVLPRMGGTLALLAEQGQAEAVLPLSRLGSLLSANQFGSSSRGQVAPAFGAAAAGQPVTVNVYPRPGQSEYEIGRIAAREIAWAAKC
jgi:phage-related protein